MSRIGLGYGLDGYWNHRTIPATWVSFCTKETSMPETKITRRHAMRFNEALTTELLRSGRKAHIDYSTDTVHVDGRAAIAVYQAMSVLEAAMAEPERRTDAELRAVIDAEGPSGFIRVTRDELDRIRQWPAPQPILHHHRRKDDPK